MDQQVEGAKLGVKIAETNTKEELETSEDCIQGADRGCETGRRYS